MNNPRIEVRPSKYATAERWIKLIQSVTIIAAAVLCGCVLIMFSRYDGEFYWPPAFVWFLWLIYSAPIMLTGFLIWSLLHGVLAVFDIAKDTADSKRILLHSLKSQEKPSP